MSDGRHRRQNRPYPMALDAGTYVWCQCGRSAKDPFCDGSHAGTGIRPRVFVLEDAATSDAGTDAGRWYYSVAYRLLRQLRIRVDLQSWWQDKSILSNRQRLVEFYSEVLLRNVHERIVVFVDEIQCIEDLPFADQLLSSIRAAHNARATDPEFSRLTFVLLGECDPVSLIDAPELSPFNVTQSIPLDDFSRDDLDIFATELNLTAEQAREASFYHTGEVTGPGTLVCVECGKELHFHKAGHIPPCPGCRGTRYQRQQAE